MHSLKVHSNESACKKKWMSRARTSHIFDKFTCKTFIVMQLKKILPMIKTIRFKHVQLQLQKILI